MHFKEYYENQYNSDLIKLYESLERPHGSSNCMIIQYPHLSRISGYLDFIQNDNIASFAVSFFWRILSDQVLYTYYGGRMGDDGHFYDYYAIKYTPPKFVGHCTSCCHYNYHPTEIFNAINEDTERFEDFYNNPAIDNIRKRPIIDVTPILEESKPIMKNKIINFFKTSGLRSFNIDGEEVWRICIAELPQTRLTSSTLPS